MKYLIDIPKYLMTKIRVILENGDYENINEFIITSLENQLMLEGGEKIQEDLFSTVVKVQKNTSKQKTYVEQDLKKWISQNDTRNIKTLFMPDSKDLELPNTTHEDSWLWGQINRIFSVKLGTRILSNLMLEKGDYIQLSNFQQKAAEIARGLGFQLDRIDNLMKRKRDEKVCVALPIGKNEEKAELRYINHFLASKRSDGILDGAMSRLKFVNIITINDNGNRIGLTQEGLAFSNLKNPILDENLNSEKTLSEEEANFYLGHIKKNVPEEFNPIRYILSSIKNGATSVSDIDKEIKKIKRNWTDVVITTQRSGALGRMHELRLIDKVKNGIKTIYRISAKGINFLKN